jgi:VanZ family protein
LFIKYNIPAFVWSVIILIILALPGDELPELSFWQFIPFFDKWVHFGLFFILSVLLDFGFSRQTNYKLLRSASLIAAGLFSSLYAGLTELLQNFIFLRTADILDFLADIIGCILGALFLKLMKRIIKHRKFHKAS